MDSIPLLALAVIAAVPALFIAARIFLYPITGLCLWVLLLPVTKTLAEFAGVPTHRIRTDVTVEETLRSIKPILWKAL